MKALVYHGPRDVRVTQVPTAGAQTGAANVSATKRTILRATSSPI